MASDQRDRGPGISENAEQFRLLVTGVEEYAVFTLDTDGRVTSWNGGAARVLGWRASEVLGKHFSVFYPPEAVVEGKPAAGLTLAQQHWVFREEGERVRKDGSRYFAEVTITPLCDARGVLNGFGKLTRDISASKRAAAALQESEARLRLSLEGAKIGTWEWNPITDEVRWDQRVRDILGVRPDAPVSGTSFLARVHLDDRAAVRAEIKRAFQYERDYEATFRIVRDDGTTRWLASRGAVVESNAEGKPLRMIGVNFDVSGQKMAELTARESEARMRLALDASGAGVWSWDAATGVNSVDGAYRAIYGFGPEEAIDTATWKARIHPQDRAEHRRTIVEALGRGGEWSEEFRIVHPELGERWLAGRGRILRDASGRITGMTGIDFDITERKLTEAALRQNEERLEQAVAVANLGFFDHDHVGSALYCSPRLKEICGCCAEDPMTFEDCIAAIHPEDRERITAAISRAHDPAGDGSYAVEHRVLHSDGSVRWVMKRSRTTFEGDYSARHPVRTIGAVADITERKMAEAVLKENATLAEQLSKIAASAPGVICSFRLTADGKASFPYAAPSMKDVYGLDPDVVREDAQAIFERTHPHDVERLKASVAASALTLSPWHATFRYRHPTKGEIWLEGYSSPVPEPDSSVIWHGFVQDVTERAKIGEKQSLLISELDHRVKNILARIAVVIDRSREGSRSIDEFLCAVEGRIHSMAQTHSRLSRSQWTGVNLSMLVEDELEPYRTPTNTVFKGPDLMLRPEAAQIIGMVLHELAANAAKYGALSCEAGRVAVSWDEQARDGEAYLELDWVEGGGPTVAPPSAVSYGTSVIRELVGHELGGSVRLEFAPGGVTCEIRIPIGRAIAA